jgi:hypothetical protein
VSPKHSKRKEIKAQPTAVSRSATKVRLFPKSLRWLDEPEISWIGILFGVLTFIVPLMLYLVTAMREPGINGDYAKFAFIGIFWGIPHTTGFPLYLMLDGLASPLPIGTHMFRIAALSAVLVAMSTHLTYRTCRLLKFSSLLALGVALLVASGHSVWMQGVIPEVYALNILLLIAPVWVLVKWDVTNDDRWFYVAIWLHILSYGNHLTVLFALPGLIIFALVRKPSVFIKGQTWIHAGSAIAVVLGLYGYILVRSTQNPVYNEGHINGDIQKFIYYITAQDYRANWTQYSSNEKHDRWKLFVTLSKTAFSNAGWFAMWLGICAAMFRDWRKAILIVLVPAGIMTASLVWKAEEPESYYAPCFLFSGILIGSLGVLIAETGSRLLSSSQDKNKQQSIAGMVINMVVSIVLIIGMLVNTQTNLKQLNFSKPNPEYARAKRITMAIQPQSLVFTAEYRYTMAIVYALRADKVRSDVAGIKATQTWDAKVAQDALNEGTHVYAFAEIAPRAKDLFDVRPVDTGTVQPELFELIPKAGQ